MGRTKHGLKGPSPLKRGSYRHVALGVLKVSTSPLKPEELMEFNPRMFTPRNSREILRFLAARNWAAEVDDGYMITKQGIHALVETGARNPFSGSFD